MSNLVQARSQKNDLGSGTRKLAREVTTTLLVLGVGTGGIAADAYKVSHISSCGVALLAYQ